MISLWIVAVVSLSSAPTIPYPTNDRCCGRSPATAAAPGLHSGNNPNAGRTHCGRLTVVVWKKRGRTAPDSHAHSTAPPQGDPRISRRSKPTRSRDTIAAVGGARSVQVTASSACVPGHGYGYQYAEEIDPLRNQLYFPLSSSSKRVPVSFSAHRILRQRRLLTRPAIALEPAVSVLLLISFCPYLAI
jgi:hypothetical protein